MDQNKRYRDYVARTPAVVAAQLAHEHQVLWHTVVTGSTAPRNRLSTETRAILRIAMRDHVHADLDEAGLDDVTLSTYHTEVIFALRERGIGNR